MCATSGRNQYAQSPFSFTVEVRDVLFRSGGLTMKEAVNFFQIISHREYYRWLYRVSAKLIQFDCDESFVDMQTATSSPFLSDTVYSVLKAISE